MGGSENKKDRQGAEESSGESAKQHNGAKDRAPI
jgi:hypothetical protein